ncbi:MAG: GNAT family N-acetyltransferase [Deltaproteobacteria bacterium]|nr:GNAT family N-acetyltransferase [Deltaproteobacteria bacterium]
MSATSCQITPLGQSYSFNPIRTFGALKQSMIDEFFRHQTARAEYVLKPDVYESTDIQHLRDSIDHDRYFTQLGFIAHRSDINPIRTETTGVVAQIPNQTGGTVELFTNAVKRNFVIPWQKYLGVGLSEVFIDCVGSTLVLEHSLCFMYDGKLVGLAYRFPSHDCMGRELQQVGWVWIDKTLKLSSRREIRSMISQWLRDSDATLFQAGIHVFNTPSLRFFEALGFTLQFAHILKK